LADKRGGVMETILKDKREISGIYYDDAEESHYSTEAGYRIMAYREDGMYCYIPYFAVYNDKDEIIARVPAWKVTVVYK
jgi:uncharacterized protein YqfB (UPF0267 family)